MSAAVGPGTRVVCVDASGAINSLGRGAPRACSFYLRVNRTYVVTRVIRPGELIVSWGARRILAHTDLYEVAGIEKVTFRTTRFVPYSPRATDITELEKLLRATNVREDA